MRIRIIYITENSMNLANKIQELISIDFVKKSEDTAKCGEYENMDIEVLPFSNFRDMKMKYFQECDFLIFIMATGIVVRVIASLLKDKFTDPGVIVIDEKGRHVISLLGGHMGGANELTEYISGLIGASPVITTATDVNDLGAFDIIVKKVNGKVDNLRDLSLMINTKLLKKEKIGIFIQGEYSSVLKKYLNGFRYIQSEEEILLSMDDKEETTIIISDSRSMYEKYKDVVFVIPAMNVLGLGCRKDTPSDVFEDVIVDYLDHHDILIDSVEIIGSIDIKKDEKCISDFSRKYGMKTEFFTVENIRKYEDKYSKSEFVKKNIGVYSVAEPVCDILSNGNIISERLAKNGVTASIGRKI